MKKRIIKIAFITLPILLIAFVVTFLSRTNTKEYKINKVLKSEYYSYLPQEAKNYIKEVYEDTGNIVLTEKNKEENTPYLNPDYIDYLELEKEQKKQVELIPNAFVLDYVSNNNQSRDELPEIYDLRNVSGDSYITPLKDQGSLGLCWAFASIEQAESFLMVKNNEPYNSNTKKFSIRQMDYATSRSGMKNYYNSENGYRSLTYGGNFYMSSIIMSNGLSLIEDDIMPYNFDESKKPLNEVFNYNNSEYEINSTIMMPQLSETNYATLKEYTDVIKEKVIENGGAYVGTQSPNRSCGYQKEDGTSLIRVDDKCVYDSGHAMQIIGWDDNYTYKYCKSNSTYQHSGNISNCKSIVEGKGAWLLRNSWGEDNEYKYTYLAYDSLRSSIGFITSISKMSDRTWDNNYHTNLWNRDAEDTLTTETKTFTKKVPGTEKIEKLKFMAFSQNGQYQITITTGNNEIKENVSVDLPGIYTLDLSSKNILLSNDSFQVKIDAVDSYFIRDTISVFTSNTTNDAIIKTENLRNFKTSAKDDYKYFCLASNEESCVIQYAIYSETKNIPSDAVITYSLYDAAGRDVSYYLDTVEDNHVAINNINTYIKIKEEIPYGEYILKTAYNNQTFSSSINIEELKVEKTVPLEGNGTINDPYQINNAEEFQLINKDLNAHYKLMNDIQFSGFQVPIGTHCEISGNTNLCYQSAFTGSLDGNNHVISNLTIQGSEPVPCESECEYNDGYIQNIGLFGLLKANDSGTAGIKNLTIKNAKVVGTDSSVYIYNSGILVGKITSSSNNKSVVLENIAIIGGEVSNPVNSGSLVGYVEGDNNIVIDKVYSSASIYSGSFGGLIGAMGNSTFTISNVQNVGILHQIKNGEEYSGILGLGLLSGDIPIHQDLQLYNFIGSGKVLYEDDVDYEYVDYLKGETTRNDDLVIDKSYLATGKSRYVSTKSLDELKNSSLYDNWNKFDSTWKLKTIDGHSRIPIINNPNIEYTRFDTINVGLGKTVNLYDYINPKIEAATNIIFEPVNNSIIELDDNGNISGISKGHTTIHVTSYYDGFDDNIDVYVGQEEIQFDSNGGEGVMSPILLLNNQDISLPKNTFTNSGYKFIGWNTKADGSGEAYSDEQIVNFNTGLTLYAQWKSELSLTSTPDAIDYGQVSADFSKSIYKKVIIKNTGDVNLSLNISNPVNDGPFASQNFENGKVLEPNEEYEVTLFLNPNGTNHNKPGSYYGTYIITGTDVNNSENSYTLEIPVQVVINPLPPKISYTTHVQTYGWQNYVSDGAMAGTTGEAKRLEGIKIKLENAPYEGDILYRTHIQSYGWEKSFKKNNQMSGTSGEAKRLEAIEIKLDGEMAEHYDVYYRVHAQKFGWLGWAKNGESAGTAAFAYRLEGIEIQLVEKGQEFSEYGKRKPFEEKLVQYTTHVQSYGWQEYTYDGNMAGTSGEAKRLEAIKIFLANQKYSGDIIYRTHIQSYGWENSWKRNNEMSGTSGEAKRLEAIQIRLTGEMKDHYDVYYRVHAQSFGWLAWAKNGESAGTAGYAKRLEGIEIVLVEKGGTPPVRDNQNDTRTYIEQ